MAQHSDLFPTSCVHQTRLPLYLPATRGAVAGKASGQKKSLETPWGTVIFHRGTLTQRHRDVFDAVMSCQTRHERWANHDGLDQVTVEFELVKVVRLLGVEHNHTWVKEMLIDMASVVAELKSPKLKANFIGGLITARESMNGTVKRKLGQFSSQGRERGGQTKLWTITLSPQLVALYDSDINIHMSKLVPSILALSNQISRAVSRWLLSHRDNQCHRVSQVFDAVGVGEDPSNRRKLLKQIKEDAEGLKQLGIEVGSGTLAKAAVTYRRNREVFFPSKAESSH